jgi:cap2 methyltransferase
VLVDPSPFAIRTSDRVTVRQEFFSDEIAAEFQRRDDVLFISDIRTADWKAMQDGAVETAVQQDMADQRRWHDIITPRASMLKFRLPWDKSSTEYLDGQIQLPVWGPQTTTETRLVVQGHTTRLYDNAKYEQQMFYFNKLTRVQLYDHDVSAHGLDHCFDCASEVRILRSYLLHAGTPKANLTAKIEQMIPCISAQASQSSRNLATWLPPVQQRKQWFPAKRFNSSQQTVEVVEPRFAAKALRGPWLLLPSTRST